MTKPTPPALPSPAALGQGSQNNLALDQGFRAFRKERYAEAIQAWGEVAPASLPRLQPVLAEAHFRRALGLTEQQAAIQDLRAAVKASPEEGRFWYHLGLALHRQRDLEGAREAYAQAARHGFARGEPLAYVRGLLELELAAAPEERGRALPGLLPEEDLIAPIQALLRQDWAALASGESLATARKAKGTPLMPGMALLLRGIGQVGLGQWAPGVQTLGALAQDLFPGPMEALRVIFLARAMDQVGRSGEARKLRTAALARTRNPSLGAEVAQTTLVDLEAFLEGGQWAQAASAAQELLKHVPCARAQVAGAIAMDQLGREAAVAGRWAEAAGHWREGLRLGGKDLAGASACAHNLALACEGQELWDQAATAWEAALAALPKRITKAQVKAGAAPGGLSPEALLQRRDWMERRALDLRRRTGMADDIVKQRKALIKRNPDDLDLRMDQVETLLNLDKVRAAEREVLAVLRLAPDHPGALEASAQINFRDGYLKAAEVTLKKVLALEPGRASARVALAEVLATRAAKLSGGLKGARKEAVQLLEEAVALSGKDGRLRLMLADLFMENRAIAQAMLQIEAALQLGKVAWRNVFRFWAQRQDLPRAKALVSAGEAQGTLDLDFYIEAGLACLRVVEDLDDPFQALMRSRRAPGSSSARDRQAEGWSNLSRKLLDQVLSLDVPLDQLLDLIGTLLEDYPDLALPFTERAVALSPSNPMHLMNLAVAQSGCGNYEAVRKTLLMVERAARSHKDRSAVTALRNLLEVVAELGPEHLHDLFCRLMQDGDFEPTAKGFPS